MKASSSCKESMKNCMENHSFAFAHLYNDEKAMDMHIHDCYEIYYSISGGKQFLIDNCFYDIQDGDLFLINQFESHYLSQIDMQKHERIIVSIDPDYLKQISTPATDLDRCFHFRETEMPHRLHLSAEEQRRFLYYIHRFPDNAGLGEDVLDHAVFLELMVFLNRAFDKRCRSAESGDEESAAAYHAQVDDILSYINTHIQEDLSLDALSSHFFTGISRGFRSPDRSKPSDIHIISFLCCIFPDMKTAGSVSMPPQVCHTLFVRLNFTILRRNYQQ